MREHPINSNTKYRYTHDLWNRLVKVEVEKAGSWFDVSEYEYFGTHWRSLKKSDTNGNNSLDEKREMYYTAGWQLIEERIDDDYINNAGIDRNMQYLWGGRYIDDIIMHREDTNGDGDFTDNDDTRWWHLTDVQFSTIAILDDAANVAERVKYDSYGRALHHDWRDVDGDRDYDSTDRSAIATIAISLGNQIGDPAYRAEADLNRDGIIDSNDLNLATTNYNAKLGAGVLSTDDVKNTIGWDGYVYNAEISSAGLYTVRFRWYSPDAGRWLTRDLLQYIDGSNIYSFNRSQPTIGLDPMGLFQDPGWIRQRDIMRERGEEPPSPLEGLKLIWSLTKGSIQWFDTVATRTTTINQMEWDERALAILTEALNWLYLCNHQWLTDRVDEILKALNKGRVRVAEMDDLGKTPSTKGVYWINIDLITPLIPKQVGPKGQRTTMYPTIAERLAAIQVLIHENYHYYRTSDEPAAYSNEIIFLCILESCAKNTITDPLLRQEILKAIRIRALAFPSEYTNQTGRNATLDFGMDTKGNLNCGCFPLYEDGPVDN